MGYEPHAELEQPSDDTKLWRYMDLGKYLDLLSTSSLALPKAAKMRDPYEGQVGPYNRQHALTALEGRAEVDIVREANFREQIGLLRGALRDCTYLSCWHAADHESAGMWSLYSDENKGVAVVTTWGNLKAGITSTVPVFGGEVKYVDYETQRVPEGNVLSIYCHKRISFVHEQEVRLIAQDYFNMRSTPGVSSTSMVKATADPAFSRADAEGALRVKADLATLICAVKVSPAAEAWFVRAVQNLTQKYDGQWDVTQSDLYRLR